MFMWGKTQEKITLSPNAFLGKKEEYLFSKLVQDFLEYARYELNFSPRTIEKYADALRWFVRDMGDRDVRTFEPQDFLDLKKKMTERGVGEARISSVIFAVRSFFNYCRKFRKISVLSSKLIKPPKRTTREVIFLTREEVDRFISVINTNTLSGLRFRALVEVLLGTGMRISEALSLDRKMIDWENKEAKIIGKGNKERRVFFNERSLEWVQKYLEARNDYHQAVFVTRGERSRLLIWDISRFFKYYREKAGIKKKLTPHILRHTVATNLLFNGCPIIHVKEILGHEKLETTCKFYLGIDKEIAKGAHKQYLNF